MFYTVSMRYQTEQDTMAAGEQLASTLNGGECIELLGDVGAGKTTFVKGLAQQLEADDVVQSPSFTISREYHCRDNLILAHYDFYRLQEAGIIDFELAESLSDPHTITVVEWGKTIDAVLPNDRIVVTIEPEADSGARRIKVERLRA